MVRGGQQVVLAMAAARFVQYRRGIPLIFEHSRLLHLLQAAPARRFSPWSPLDETARRRGQRWVADAAAYYAIVRRLDRSAVALSETSAVAKCRPSSTWTRDLRFEPTEAANDGRLSSDVAS